ncbi:MAG TPA: exopolysaccharide transport family protein [Methylorubrum populi]|uniref:Exopolysaccharide transport family protein n=1 Tax=Methylorubrum populi TaxID=223967 RepID=A0A921JEK2_9HYPH|nr:exopolysaccharide transport family protein [Methylorubrum populi]
MDPFHEAEPSGGRPSLTAHYEAVTGHTLGVLWRRRLLIASCAVVSALGVGAASLAMPPSYVAEVLLQFDFGQTQDVRGAGKSGPQIALEPASVVESEARIIRSFAIAQAVAGRLEAEAEASHASQEPAATGWVASLRHALSSRVQAALPALPGTRTEDETQHETARDAMAQGLMRALTVGNDAKAYLISIGFRDRDPRRAAEIANTFATEYLARKMQAASLATERASRWYAEQIQVSRGELTRLEGEIDAFRKRTGFVESAREGVDLREQQLRDALTDLSNASAKRLAEEARLRRAQDVLRFGGVPSAVDTAISPVIQQMLADDSKLRQELEQLTAVSGDNHPSVLRLKASIAALQQRLQARMAEVLKVVEVDLGAARGLESAAETRVTTLRRSLIESKALEAKLRALQAEATTTRDRLRVLDEGYQTANALSELKPVMAQMLAPAKVPTLPSGPSLGLVLGLGLFAGAGAGSALALALDRRDRGYRSQGEMESETGLPCLALLPSRPAGERPDHDLVFREAVRAAVAELVAVREPLKVVLVTSAMPGEGKSVVARSVARSLAAMGRRVLILDGSPRRAAIEDRHAPRSDREAETGDDEADSRISTIRRVSGLKDGHDIYAEPTFGTLVREARERYDVILVEVPPVLLLGDVALLRQHADAVVHVVAWHGTQKAAVTASLAYMRRLGLTVAGLVLNKVDLERHHGRASDRGTLYRDFSHYYRNSA